MPGIASSCFGRNSWSTRPDKERHKVLTKYRKSEGEVGLHIHEAHVTHTTLKGNMAAFLPFFKETGGYEDNSLMALWDQGVYITGIVQIKGVWKYIMKLIPILGGLPRIKRNISMTGRNLPNTFGLKKENINVNPVGTYFTL